MRRAHITSHSRDRIGTQRARERLRGRAASNARDALARSVKQTIIFLHFAGRPREPLPQRRPHMPLTDRHTHATLLEASIRDARGMTCPQARTCGRDRRRRCRLAALSCSPKNRANGRRARRLTDRAPPARVRDAKTCLTRVMRVCAACGEPKRRARRIRLAISRRAQARGGIARSPINALTRREPTRAALRGQLTRSASAVRAARNSREADKMAHVRLAVFRPARGGPRPSH